MQIIGIKDIGRNFVYKWPEEEVVYPYYIDYIGRDEEGEHVIRLGFCKTFTYGKERWRVVIWINNHPHAEFIGADDFDVSGELLSEIKVPGARGERICRYPDEPIPARYAMFKIEGMPNRIQGPGVRSAWAVVANIADHKTLITLAALKKLERER
jgi:hypothetical protein